MSVTKDMINEFIINFLRKNGVNSFIQTKSKSLISRKSVNPDFIIQDNNHYSYGKGIWKSNLASGFIQINTYIQLTNASSSFLILTIYPLSLYTLVMKKLFIKL